MNCVSLSVVLSSSANEHYDIVPSFLRSWIAWNRSLSDLKKSSAFISFKSNGNGRGLKALSKLGLLSSASLRPRRVLAATSSSGFSVTFSFGITGALLSPPEKSSSTFFFKGGKPYFSRIVALNFSNCYYFYFSLTASYIVYG